MDYSRRTFIKTGVAAAAVAGSSVAMAAEPKKLALGFDNFSIRGWGWKAPKLLEFAAEQKCDGVLFSDLDVYENHGAAHLKAVREQAAGLGLFVHAGTGSICPSSGAFKDKWGDAEAHLRVCLKVAKGLGTRVVRCYLGTGRDRQSEGGIRARIADTVKVLKVVRNEALDLGVKFGVENHAGDMQAHELRDLIEEAGADFVGATIDAGNAAWTLEDPVANLEVLAPYAVSGGIRDTMVWTTENGVKAQWAAIGEGNVDMALYFQRWGELCPEVPVVLEIISEYGKNIDWKKPGFWEAYPEARAADFARFLALAESGTPKDGFQGRGKEAAQEFQMAELTRSIKTCREKFGLGRTG
jgi:sugar phosphate isomerase/epimerase